MAYGRRGINRTSGNKRSIETRYNSSGYRQFKDKSTGKWIYTHRRVAEKMVDGDIYPGREVHHKDGDKTNNRPSNLILLSKANHLLAHGKSRG